MEHLFYAGDNLRGLELLQERGVRVDLVYIDPPFSTNTEFRMDSERANTVSGPAKWHLSIRCGGMITSNSSGCDWRRSGASWQWTARFTCIST